MKTELDELEVIFSDCLEKDFTPDTAAARKGQVQSKENNGEIWKIPESKIVDTASSP